MKTYVSKILACFLIVSVTAIGVAVIILPSWGLLKFIPPMGQES